ncbi:HalOD1 output domain-containing protein [Halomarina rubra]|uniref:HalOD1 output domain-containing protein n=1 Tax=Halomarina rubra TaxID=2071873 RepID=A0ABD6B0G1_9EURY|nr:HalOD1 output domain-containing protein [Halomarina rubra]
MTSPRPSVAVVEAVANAEGCDPLDLPPLYDVVDPDSVDRLCPLNGGGEITIRYHGYAVTVRDAERITVERLDAPEAGTQVAAGVGQ